MVRIPELQRRVGLGPEDAYVPQGARLARVGARTADDAAEMMYSLRAAQEQQEATDLLAGLGTAIKATEEELSTITDPVELGTTAAQAYGSLSQNALNGLNPRVRAEVQAQVVGLTELADLRAQKRAREIVIAKSVVSIENAVDEHARAAALAQDPLEAQQHLDLMNRAIEGGVKTGALFPKDEENMRERGLGLIDQYQVDAMIQKNPYLAQAMLLDADQWQNLPGPQRRSAIRTAQGKIDQMERREIAAAEKAERQAKQIVLELEDEAEKDVLFQVQNGKPDGTGFDLYDLQERRSEMSSKGIKAAISSLRQPPAVQDNQFVLDNILDGLDKREDVSQELADALSERLISQGTYERYRTVNREIQKGGKTPAQIDAKMYISQTIQSTQPEAGYQEKVSIRERAEFALRNFDAWYDEQKEPPTREQMHDFASSEVARMTTAQMIENDRKGRVPPYGLENLKGLDDQELLRNINLSLEWIAELKDSGQMGEERYRNERDNGMAWLKEVEGRIWLQERGLMKVKKGYVGE